MTCMWREPSGREKKIIPNCDKHQFILYVQHQNYNTKVGLILRLFPLPFASSYQALSESLEKSSIKVTH